MAEFSISVDLSSLNEAIAALREPIFAGIADALAGVAETGVERWKTAVQKAPGIWSGEKDAYGDTIKAAQVGPLRWEISSDYKFVEDIETGRQPYDMKRMLNTSMKVRVGKTGKRYLIIPIRHGTPGNDAHGPAMPKEIYADARRLAPSKIVGHGRRLSGTGAYDIKTKRRLTVNRNIYRWGGSLTRNYGYEKPGHKTDKYDGMYRFETSSGKQKSSAYLTFRVMSEGSTGWIIPAKPGLFIAKAVAESLQRTADAEISAAVANGLAS